MDQCVNRQVSPLGTWQSGQVSAIDLVHHVVKGCHYSALRQVVWVLALLDKVRSTCEKKWLRVSLWHGH